MSTTSGVSNRIYSRIADQIAHLIESGEFGSGDLLPPERELARRLGVSRSSVREALIALEVLGHVDVRVGHGVTVLDRRGDAAAANGDVMGRAARAGTWRVDERLGLPELGEDVEIPPFALLSARRLIEPETAQLAACHASEEQIELIRVAFGRNVHDNEHGSVDNLGDRLFHIRIAEASGNAAYAVQIRYLLGHRYGALFRRLQSLYTPDDMPRRSQNEHASVLDAIERRDARSARMTMRQHLDAVIGIFSRP